MAKRSGASGHPCLTALCSSTSCVVLPGMHVRREICVPCSVFIAKLIKVSGRPSRWRARCILGHGRVSYALDIS